MYILKEYLKSVISNFFDDQCEFYKDYYFGRSQGCWNNRIHNVTFDEIDPHFGFNLSNDTNNIINLGQLVMNYTLNKIIDYGTNPEEPPFHQED